MNPVIVMGLWVSIGLLNYLTTLFVLGVYNNVLDAREVRNLCWCFLLSGPIGVTLVLLFGLFVILHTVYGSIKRRLPTLSDSFDVSRMAWQAGYRIRSFFR